MNLLYNTSAKANYILGEKIKYVNIIFLEVLKTKM